MTVITLMTDFGIKDGNVGMMKGVIWSISPQAQIADLSHMIGPQNIQEAALILARAVPYFPAGTIHLVVVDPGVGTERRPMGARIGDSYFVGPDNGIITTWLERTRAQEENAGFYRLDNPGYQLPVVSHVFHGRDIFSPAAAHLAAGIPLSAFGPSFSDPVLLPLPRPVRAGNVFRGEVVHIDHFGNISSNIHEKDLGDALVHKDRIAMRIGSTEIRGMVDTFGQRPEGELIALLGSTGNLIISVVNGSAAARLGAKVGDPVEVDLSAGDVGR